MDNENTVLAKSEKFAVRIINLYKYLTLKKKEFVLAKQILRSGTSIGANLFEAECAISNNDWLAKIYIALKECNETLYWLRLLVKTDFILEKEFSSIYDDCMEIRKILSASTKTMADKMKTRKGKATPHSTLHSPHL